MIKNLDHIVKQYGEGKSNKFIGLFYLFCHVCENLLPEEDHNVENWKVLLPIGKRIIDTLEDIITSYTDAEKIYHLIVAQRGKDENERLMMAKLSDEWYDGDDEAVLMAYDAAIVIEELKKVL